VCGWPPQAGNYQPDTGRSQSRQVGIVRTPWQGSITGHFGDDPAALNGYYQLGRAEVVDIGGYLCGHRLWAKVSSAEGGLAPTGTVVAEGTVAEEPFELFVSMSSDLARAIVRGSLGGRPVSLDMTRHEPPAPALIVGEYSGPHPFLALVVGVVMHFLMNAGEQA
jgi:hypothetical protein